MYKAIIVDDEPWTMIDISNNVGWGANGFTLAGSYQSPRAALADLEHVNPDLIITDIKMPGMDGFEFIKKCKASGSDAAFIILSGYSDFELAKKAIQASVLDYCVKPVNPEALEKTIQYAVEYLDKKRNRRAIVHLDLKEQESPYSFEKILNFIEKNIDKKLTLNEVAKEFSFNRNYICDLFNKNIGKTFVAYLTERRIERAKILLADTNYNLEEISAMAGFGDYFYFNKVFKKEMGITPSVYRRSRREGERF
ncbi:response regulator transcription factor [Ruminococcus gauvreauii]|uniref:Stage 0 sporulation protein A homolog n=1 Tax=Ruminococcus gauvreauii TaxID=438033 RepID=A0ABY5VJM8_9FIRM|nr:helix-turn-helix domain-containing protein [Ruminococcus gauvreauii]UWP60809.1 response regulator [Ruminococcus gauvreauii]